MAAALGGHQRQGTYVAYDGGAVDQEGNRVLGAAPVAVADPWTQPELDPWGQAGAAASEPATWAGAAAWSPPTAPDTAFLAGTAGANAWDSGTDTDTSDDDGTETLDDQDLRGLEHLRAQEQAFWAYRTAKRRWRRYTGEPVRRARRFAKRQGKGKGKGQVFFGEGKGSGKGFGRNRNPRGRDGQIMKCSFVLPNGSECGSEFHPHARDAGQSGAGAAPQQYNFTSGLQGPLAGILGSAPAPANTFLVTEATTTDNTMRLKLRVLRNSEGPL